MVIISIILSNYKITFFSLDNTKVTLPPPVEAKRAVNIGGVAISFMVVTFGGIFILDILTTEIVPYLINAAKGVLPASKF